MIDRRTPEQKKEAALRCFETIKAKGRHSCAGCDLDFYCPMAESCGRWFRERFLPAIDPGGNLRG